MTHTQAKTPATRPAIPSATAGFRRVAETYTVQQAAALTGLSKHTLRYYERVGLIQPMGRLAGSGHRRYSAADLTRLDSLACLRATGMPIDQMRRYFELRAEGGARLAQAAEALIHANIQED
jgi:DNA-binding transcriptional MerR regulator